jgi:transglutaminase-like putative cysteine protease
VTVGCDLPARPPLKGDAEELTASFQKTEQDSDSSGAALETPGAVFERNWETWDAFFVNQKHVGYSHVSANQSEGDGLVRYELESRLYLNQGPLRLLQQVSQVSHESRDGHLREFEAAVSVGPATTRFMGRVINQDLSIKTIRGNAQVPRKVSWDSTYRGLVALEQSLRQRPMREKGEDRMLKMLLPGRYEVATARLRCIGSAAVPLLDGELRELIEIDCQIQPEEGPPTYSTIWTDDLGEIVRTHSPALELIAYRTSEDRAKNFAANDEVVASLTLVGKVKDLHLATRVGYKVERTDAAAKAQITPGINPFPGQFVRQLDENMVHVLVSRRSETPKGFLSSELVPIETDLKESWYIDYEHGRIGQFIAQMIGKRELSDRELALELTRAVRQNLVDRGAGEEIQKASVVAANWAGNPTELAILLSALLRAKQIPARLALGVKYFPGQSPRLGYHAWTLAYVDDQWIQLDPSEGGTAAADRLILSTTGLESGNAVQDLVPLLETMRAIKVEVAGQS